MTTAAELIQEVRKIAAERPDFVYGKQGLISPDTCSYFGRDVGDESGSPCIIGQALKNLGVDTSLLKQAEDECDDNMGIASALDVKHIELAYTDREALWLSHVQRKQDNGETWAEAVESADKWVEL